MDDLKCNENWLPEASYLWAAILDEWELSPDGVATLRVACDSLSRYHEASIILNKEGLTIKSGDLVRKHPACEIAKNSLAGFLAAMRSLGLEEETNKPGPGNPGTYKLWLKRRKA